MKFLFAFLATLFLAAPGGQWMFRWDQVET